jgi:TIR domain-containing protein
MTRKSVPQSRRPETRVFISYSRKDMAFAERLEAALKARGIEPLIDRSEIYAFEDWWKRIQALIAQADTIVMVLSPDAIASEVCGKEVAFATSLNKRFAPIVWRRVDDSAVPESLARLNFIFFDDEAQFEESTNRLVEALATNIDWIRKHTVGAPLVAGRTTGTAGIAVAFSNPGGGRALGRLASARRAGTH